MRKLTNMGGKTLFVMVLSSALLAAGCMEEGGAFGGAGSRERTLALRMEAATKVSVDDASGVCSWTSGDAIAVRIYGEFPEENTYKTAPVDVSSSTVNVELEGDQDIRWYSVYPASARVDNQYGVNVNTAAGALHVVYPASYAVPSGLSGEALNKWSPVPMVAANTDGGTPPTPKSVLDFYHVGGVLRIKLSNVPAGTTSCTVTLEGMTDITGTFKVENPGTATANTDVLVAGTVAGGDNNTVEFTGIPSSTEKTTLWLNVPLPTGNYSSLTRVKVTAGSKEMTKAVKWNGGMVHAQGRRLSFNFDAQAGELDNVNLSPAGDATLWKGQPYQCVAMACDVNGLFVSGATISWSSSDASVAEVDNAGNVTAKAAGSAVLTATATVGTSTATADYTVYVNEITGLTLSCGATTTLIIGKDKPVTATATYTMNGDPEPPLVDWSVTEPATPAKTVTASGAANTLTVAATATVGSSGTITVSIPANKYGTNAPQSATCSYKILSSNYLPGAFSISPTEQVYFSRGNLQVNYTNNGGTVTREWLFSENQWDAFYPSIAELKSLPTPAEGTTVKLSHFGWATAGHERTDSGGSGLGYGYNSNQARFEPHEVAFVDNPSPLYPYVTPNGYGIGEDAWKQAIGNYTESVKKGFRENSWNWNNSPLREYCEWGVHFDDDGVGHDKWYEGNSWFTMSYAQWSHLVISRPEAAQKRGSAVIISADGNFSVGGLVLLPDDWVCPAGCTFIPGGSLTHDSMSPWSQIEQIYYIDTTWPLMEAAGAVFLPGARNRTTLSFGGAEYIPECQYWTSSITNTYSRGETTALQMFYNNEGESYKIPSMFDEPNRSKGLSVRLVRMANP